MIAIKVLLVAALFAASLGTLSGPAARRLALRRLLGLGLVAVAVVAVIWPGLTTWVAHLVGVGRGTDLVLYLAVLAFTFVAVAVYQRISLLEASVAALSRELALRGAEHDPTGLTKR